MAKENNPSLVCCHQCGQPFGNEPQLKKIREKLPHLTELSSNCPKCRRKKFVATVENARLYNRYRASVC